MTRRPDPSSPLSPAATPASTSPTAGSTSGQTPFRIRPERFGAIVATENPPMLAWVDRTMARKLGLADAPCWHEPLDMLPPEQRTPEALSRLPLSAPTEVHVLMTGRCQARCTYCYADSSPEASVGQSPEALRMTIDALARLGVFHLALGGGESTLRPDLFALAAYAREKGLVPNLTTSGLGMTPRLAEECRVFGQVNVSIDALGDAHRESRGDTSFGAADRALRLLLAAGVTAGINTVLSRQTFEQLPALVAYAAEVGASEVELLRLKPSGRAREIYAERRLTDEQHLRLLPEVLRLARQHRLHLKLDCSFAPMICAHAPPIEVLEAFNVLGCDAGNSLGAILPDGSVSGCSFVASSTRDGAQIDAVWASQPVLEAFRTSAARPAQPCDRCEYQSVCKGGCRAVSIFVSGRFDAPDPECPRVLAWKHTSDAAPAGRS